MTQGSAARRMGVAAILLGVSTLLSRILGFGREAVISQLYGASMATDAYYAAFTLPDLMSYFLAGGTLSITFIPLFSSYMAREDEAGGWRLFSIVASTMGLLLVAATIAGELAAPWLVGKLNPGFTDPEQLRLTILMTRIVLPAQLAFYIGGLLQATLLTREVFWPAAISPLIYNVCIIAGGLLLGPWLGMAGFSVGVLVGALLGPLAVPLWAARHHVSFRFELAPRDEGYRQFLWLTLPLMVGVSLVTIDEWLLRYFGSTHASGSITWLNHSRKMMMVIFAIIGQAAGQAALPFLTRLYHEGREADLAELMCESLRRVVFFAILGAAGLATVSEPLIRVIFERGAFHLSDSLKTAELLVLFCVGLTSWTVQSFAVRGFYARQDTLTPMILGSGVVLIAAPVYWGLNAGLGVRGLAIASAVGITLNAAATIAVYRWRAGALALTPIVESALRALAIATTGAAAAWTTRHALAPHLPALITGPTLLWRLAALITLSAAYGLGAAATTFALLPPELDVLWQRIARKLRR